MQVDFYQLQSEPVDTALPLIARKALDLGERLLVVAGDEALRGRISEGLWRRLPASFLAHGQAGGPDDARQPILLSDRVEAANGARFVVLADGVWREEVLGEGAFTRAFLFFDEMTVQPARQLWVDLGKREGLTRRFWKQQDRGWVQAG